MYNDLEYDIQTLELPNIVMAEKKGGAHATTVTDPFMAPLIMRLAKTRPQWRFIGTSRTISDDNNKPWLCHTFKVYQGNEQLGVILKEYSGKHGSVFGMDSRRLAAKRNRGSYTTTKDVDKAYKLITSNFGPKTADELARETLVQVTRVASMISGTVVNKHSRHVTGLYNISLNFARQNWAAFYDYALGNGAKQEILDSLEEVIADREEVHRMQTALDAPAGSPNAAYVITLRGSEYLVNHGDDKMNIWTTEQLPPNLKRSIGLLKLAERGEMIAGVGFKANDTDLFVFKQEESNDEGQS